jgi:hypothetical protein
MSHRRPFLFVLHLAAAVAGGFVATSFVRSEAQAQSIPRPPQLPSGPSTSAPLNKDPDAVTVPDSGLRFRRGDGRMVATLNTDGTLDVFDAQGRKKGTLDVAKVTELETRLTAEEKKPSGMRCQGPFKVSDIKSKPYYDNMRVCLQH